MTEALFLEAAECEEKLKEQGERRLNVSGVLKILGVSRSGYMSNRRLSRAISADYFRRKHLSQSAVNETKAHYIGCHRRLSRAYFSSAMAGLK